MIGYNEQDIEDDLSYDEISYKSSDSVSIDEIPGVEYDPETVDKINDDNVQSFEDTMDDLSVETPEPEEENLRRSIISNISVSNTGRKRVMNVEGNPFNQVQPGGDVIPSSPEPVHAILSVRPARRRTQPTRINISSNKGSTYDVALVQAI